METRQVLRLWEEGREVAAGSAEHNAKGEAAVPLPALAAGAYRLRYDDARRVRRRGRGDPRLPGRRRARAPRARGGAGSGEGALPSRRDGAAPGALGLRRPGPGPRDLPGRRAGGAPRGRRGREPERARDPDHRRGPRRPRRAPHRAARPPDGRARPDRQRAVDEQGAPGRVLDLPRPAAAGRQGDLPGARCAAPRARRRWRRSSWPTCTTAASTTSCRTSPRARWRSCPTPRPCPGPSRASDRRQGQWVTGGEWHQLPPAPELRPDRLIFFDR